MAASDVASPARVVDAELISTAPTLQEQWPETSPILVINGLQVNKNARERLVNIVETPHGATAHASPPWLSHSEWKWGLHALSRCAIERKLAS